MAKLENIYIRKIDSLLDLKAVKEILDGIEEFNEKDVKTCLEVVSKIGIEYEGMIACVNEKIAGFLLFTENTLAHNVFELLWIVVAKEFQKNGIGSALMEKFIEEVKKRDGRLIILHTSEHYLKAKRLYEKFGFRCEGIIRDFYNIGDSKEIWVLRLR
jgi:ribosomal protein S18 acetylase RimI-like enzyme